MDRLYVILMLIPIVAFHGFFQSWVAHLFGDDTAKNKDRMTLNPMNHIDYWGTLVIPALGILLNPAGSGVVGWGKRVPVNPYNLKRVPADEFLIALAGPISNLLFAFFIFVAGRLVIKFDSEFQSFIIQFGSVAVFLAIFNCLPFPWLDGWTIVQVLFKISPEIMEQHAVIWYIGLLALINFTPLLGLLNVLAGSVTATMINMINF